MTREQALNYLYSSGFSEGQVNAVVEALEQDCDKCEYANPCLYCKHEFSLTSTDEPMTMIYPTIFCEDTISRSEAIDQMEQSYNILDATDRIKALPSVQAVCSDTISREAVQAEIRDWVALDEPLSELHKRIDKMPSVQPRSKGHWISREGAGQVLPFWGKYQCSECGECAENSNFCPNCGADMRTSEVDK